MSDREAAQKLKMRLDRTWSAFFARHGNFRPVQLAAIPPLLDGKNVVLCAATASGKTEAALAPLVERHCPPLMPGLSPHELRIVYLTPTRALVNGLYKRLQPIFETLRLPLAVKTRDWDTFVPERPAALLITRPESFDSLLCSKPRLFISLRAIVIDELHLFNSTVRGDQLRVLLNRARRIRDYAAHHGDSPDAAIQYAALSATLPDPAGTAAQYFLDPVVINFASQRRIEAEYLELTAEDTSGFARLFETIRRQGWRKMLAFCNSRAEVEHYAAIVRESSPFADAVFVHYSNLTASRRHEIEEAFAAAEAAICFASSTLELGIDIGDIDAVALIGAPGGLASFVQRIGRGGRRKNAASVICLWRTPLERLMFEALCSNPEAYSHTPKPFQAGVAVQQIFSLLKQNPSGAVRLPELASLFDGLLALDDVKSLIAQLTQLDYLKIGRPGEWRASNRLNLLVDKQNSAHPGGPSLHSNIRVSETALQIRNYHTHQVIATVDAEWLARDVVTLEGRPVQIEWADGDAIWVDAVASETPHAVHYVSARQVLKKELASLLAIQLGFEADQAPLVQCADGLRWYHWLGDLYGWALFELLRMRLPLRNSEYPGLYFYTHQPFDRLPSLSRDEIVEYVSRRTRQLEAMMNLSAFHYQLPVKLRNQVVIEQFGVELFESGYRRLRIETDDKIVAKANLGLCQF